MEGEDKSEIKQGREGERDRETWSGVNDPERPEMVTLGLHASNNASSPVLRVTDNVLASHGNGLDWEMYLRVNSRLLTRNGRVNPSAAGKSVTRPAVATMPLEAISIAETPFELAADRCRRLKSTT